MKWLKVVSALTCTFPMSSMIGFALSANEAVVGSHHLSTSNVASTRDSDTASLRRLIVPWTQMIGFKVHGRNQGDGALLANMLYEKWMPDALQLSEFGGDHRELSTNAPEYETCLLELLRSDISELPVFADREKPIDARAMALQNEMDVAKGRRLRNYLHAAEVLESYIRSVRPQAVVDSERDYFYAHRAYRLFDFIGQDLRIDNSMHLIQPINVSTVCNDLYDHWKRLRDNGYFGPTWGVPATRPARIELTELEKAMLKYYDVSKGRNPVLVNVAEPVGSQEMWERYKEYIVGGHRSSAELAAYNDVLRVATNGTLNSGIPPAPLDTTQPSQGGAQQ